MAGFILGVQLHGIEGLSEAADLDALDFVLVGDPQGRTPAALHQDPLSIAAWLMTRTRQVGLAAVVPTGWAPFNVARAVASFDLLSSGRCGWMPGSDETMSADQAAEHLDVVRQLFDSWDDDALVLDKAAGIFADRAKVRRVRHEGAYYTVDGPLNAPRPPQGHPVLIQLAGQADANSDIVLGPPSELPAPTTGGLRIALLPVDFRAGSAADLAQEMLDLRAAGFDGALCAPRDPAVDVTILARDVAPRLQTVGPRPAERSGGTFRDRLGLARPANRFARAAA